MSKIVINKPKISKKITNFNFLLSLCYPWWEADLACNECFFFCYIYAVYRTKPSMRLTNWDECKSMDTFKLAAYFWGGLIKAAKGLISLISTSWMTGWMMGCLTREFNKGTFGFDLECYFFVSFDYFSSDWGSKKSSGTVIVIF